MDVIGLLKSVEEAYQDVQVKASARDSAATAHQDAVNAYNVAADKLSALQESLNAILGKFLPGGDQRVRMG